jgi:hypothetical protein
MNAPAKPDRERSFPSSWDDATRNGFMARFSKSGSIAGNLTLDSRRFRATPPPFRGVVLHDTLFRHVLGPREPQRRQEP